LVGEEGQRVRRALREGPLVGLVEELEKLREEVRLLREELRKFRVDRLPFR